MGGKITKRQLEILDLLIKGLPQIKIASNLNISKQRVSFLVNKLIKSNHLNNYKKGGLTKRDTLGFNIQKSIPDFYKTWRFEAAFFMVNIYYAFPKYHAIRKKRGNYGIPEKEFTIMLYEDFVRIQFKKGVFFRGNTKEEAVMKGEEAFNNFLDYAAKKYGFNYYKEGRASITLNSCELAEENGVLGINVKKITNRNYVLFKDQNNKSWLKMDLSKFPIIDTEYMGKNTIRNAHVLEPFLNDLVFNRPLSNSQLSSRINDNIKTIAELNKLLEKIIKRSV